jgi:hypothetical protein
MSTTTTPKNRCRDCRNRMTWAALRVQCGRCLRRGLTIEQARAAQPRCQKCMTKYLRAFDRAEAGKGAEVS